MAISFLHSPLGSTSQDLEGSHRHLLPWQQQVPFCPPRLRLSRRLTQADLHVSPQSMRPRCTYRVDKLQEGLHEGPAMPAGLYPARIQ